MYLLYSNIFWNLFIFERNIFLFTDNFLFDFEDRTIFLSWTRSEDRDRLLTASGTLLRRTLVLHNAGPSSCGLRRVLNVRSEGWKEHVRFVILRSWRRQFVIRCAPFCSILGYFHSWVHLTCRSCWLLFAISFKLLILLLYELLFVKSACVKN